MKALSVLGVTVHDVTYGEALETICRFVADGGPHMVTTPNPEFVMLARRDQHFRATLTRAALAIPDGVGLLWAGRVSGCPFREHVRGTDLVVRLASHSAAAGHRWFLLGAAPGIAEKAATALRTMAPGLDIAGTFPGDASPAGDAETRRVIRSAGRVDIALVAYGARAQELWMDRNLGEIGIPVGIGVGGVFNYLAGVSPRAPYWMRKLELEWLHRLVTEPWRWRRQAALPLFAAHVALATWLPGSPGAVQVALSAEGDSTKGLSTS